MFFSRIRIEHYYDSYRYKVIKLGRYYSIFTKILFDRIITESVTHQSTKSIQKSHRFCNYLLPYCIVRVICNYSNVY